MSLTQQQIREAFDLFDADCSGAISASELELILKGLGFADMPKQEINALVKAMDTDGSGEIEYPEFEKSVLKLSQPGSLDEIWKAYKLFDVEQKGRITLADLKRVAAEQENPIPEDVLKHVLKVVCEYDTKGISFDEWKHVMTSLNEANKVSTKK
eukprot:PhF_6_TR8378/c0_g1_i1/m.13125/K16465/CETN1; centrin-1